MLSSAALLFVSLLPVAGASQLLGRIVDADSGKPIPARVYGGQQSKAAHYYSKIETRAQKVKKIRRTKNA